MNICQETSGFLFAHHCGRPGLFACVQCGKSICEQHGVLKPPEGLLCVTCHRTTMGSSESDWGSEDDDSDDPHFYSSRYRSRAGGAEPDDPMDFTEGDRAALDDEGGEFDMGGS
jgi:hypothetical protein